MRCDKARTMISLDMDGILPPEDTSTLSQHLTGCEECVSYRDDLMVGARMLHATGAEPSDAFEWKLQLKLNQALQEAAGSAVLYEEPQGRSWFGWARGFAMSSVAGLAATLAVAMWLLPQGLRTVEGSAEISGTTLTQVDSSPVSSSAGNADRRSISPDASRQTNAFSGPRGGLGLGGQVVSHSRVFSTDNSATPDSWSANNRSRSLATMKGEVSWLRNQVRQAQSENDSLRALLEDQQVGYLDRNETRRE